MLMNFVMYSVDLLIGFTHRYSMVPFSYSLAKTLLISIVAKTAPNMYTKLMPSEPNIPSGFVNTCSLKLKDSRRNLGMLLINFNKSPD
jgi:hypothetical protein